MSLDSKFEINFHGRAYIRWLSIMEQLVQSEDVPFTLGAVSGHEHNANSLLS